MPTLKKIYIQFYPKLVAVLPMDDATFIAQLYSHDLLPGNGKAMVAAQQTRADKASYFLDKHIDRGFKNDNDNPSFQTLLSIMMGNGGYDDTLLKSTADNIRESNTIVCVCM